MAERVLVIGGQRSGKSRYAEGLVTATGKRLVYLATATAGDGEMTDRINLHQSRRGQAWRTVEEPISVAAVLGREANPENAILLDCLTIWLSNLMGAACEIDRETEKLVEAVRTAAGPLVIVSNEVGSGIIPHNALSRAYADAMGTLNQRVAAAVDRVVLVVAGLPLVLKPAPRMETVQ